MMMGGRWAYEMLGWGGFWGWDPVEVGPFIPWLGLVAFLHAAQIQTVRGGFNKPTLFAALIPFLTAMYESFPHSDRDSRQFQCPLIFDPWRRRQCFTAVRTADCADCLCRCLAMALAADAKK